MIPQLTSGGWQTGIAERPHRQHASWVVPTIYRGAHPSSTQQLAADADTAAAAGPLTE